MNQRIKDCLEKKDPNYLYPFFQQYDISKDDIREEMEAIEKSGCRGFCVENREHTDFCGDRWWSDMDFILKWAHERDMKVWLQDDVHFPTGFANNAIKNKYPELKRKCVGMEKIDVPGPQLQAGIYLDGILKENESVFAVVAYKRSIDGENEIYSDAVDLTDQIRDGLIFWNVPEGMWVVFVLYFTIRGNDYFENFIDVLNPESCKLMLSEIYEPHYERYKDYFGNTFEAMFTDEPCFANFSKPYYDYCEKLGHEEIIIPWRGDMVQMLASKEGWTEKETLLLLPALWRDLGGKTPVIRRRYMDIITSLYSENFVKLLGDWSREHGVLYLGHVLEDMNSSMRMGCGAGHFYRAQVWQDMSGFDLVNQQLQVGNRAYRYFMPPDRMRPLDPRFYLYVIGRLAASCGHLYPQMQGRVLCECAGANGWSEGLSAMKYMLDAMIIGGGNIFVPAVFSPKRNNNDYPPFVYDHGENPQFPFLRSLMMYVNRLCHMLSGGIHRANALVYYHAEGDWCGNANPPEDTVTPLAIAHIDYDFAPWDLLASDAVEIKDRKLYINQECFDALIIPPCEFLPTEILHRFDEIGQNVPVIFARSIPKESETRRTFEPKYASCMPIEALAGWFYENKFIDYAVDGSEDLMHIHISHDGTETYFLFNLSSGETIDTEAIFAYRGDYVLYDAWNNTSTKRNTSDGRIRLVIPPKGTLLISFGAEIIDDNNYVPQGELENIPWFDIDKDMIVDVNIKASGDTEWKPYSTMRLRDLRNLAPQMPHFSGTLRYTFEISGCKDVHYMDLGTVGEVAELIINDVSCGQLVSSPFFFDVAKNWKEGNNKVEIIVASNCGYRKRDYYTVFLTMPPTGLIGPIRLGTIK